MREFEGIFKVLEGFRGNWEGIWRVLEGILRVFLREFRGNFEGFGDNLDGIWRVLEGVGGFWRVLEEISREFGENLEGI